MAEFNQDNVIRAYLQDWIRLLEERLNYPKNSWKRQQDLNQELSDAQQRLQVIERQSFRSRNQTFDTQHQEGDGFRPAYALRASSNGHRQRPIAGQRSFPQNRSSPIHRQLSPKYSNPSKTLVLR